jgi:hypothetical protein
MQRKDAANRMTFTTLRAASAVLVTSAIQACPSAPARVATVLPLFGPAVSNEVIAGRAEDLDPHSPVLLLVGERTLVQIDLASGTATRKPLRIPPQDSCWGLARLRDGSLWTLKGRTTLLQIGADGGVLQERALDTAHFGLFGEDDRLIYQPAEFMAPGQALFAARPVETIHAPFGDLKTRAFKLARASAAALNMVSCGIADGPERPCWFPDEAAVTLVDGSGHMRRVLLPGLSVVAPETLLTSDTPARPVRDAYVDKTGTIWILSSGTATAASDERPGAWLVARYTSAGGPLGISRLPEPVRLILRADARRAVVITGGGMVAEVVP